jgi:hypothetical protein
MFSLFGCFFGFRRRWRGLFSSVLQSVSVGFQLLVYANHGARAGSVLKKSFTLQVLK